MGRTTKTDAEFVIDALDDIGSAVQRLEDVGTTISDAVLSIDRLAYAVEKIVDVLLTKTEIPAVFRTCINCGSTIVPRDVSVTECPACKHNPAED